LDALTQAHLWYGEESVAEGELWQTRIPSWYAYNRLMRGRWRTLLRVLGLSRVGRAAFTGIAVLGFLLAVADDVIPRWGSESDLGPNAAAIVGVYTIGLLGFVAATDAIVRVARRPCGLPRRTKRRIER
jgi:hypothetical protein